MIMVEVVLLQDVANLGKKGEVVSVKDGYAVNYLLPKKLARRATKQDKEAFLEQKRREEKIKEQANEIFANLEKVIKEKLKGALLIERKVSSTGTLYDALDKRELVKILKERIHELLAFDHIEILYKGAIKKVGRHVIELEVRYNQQSKKVPVVVEVVSAGKTPRLKSETLEDELKRKKK